MTSKDNSVNIELAKRYHHGDLRAALIAAGLELLAKRSADDLSLREVARRVGVSATAVYRHFPDKQALLSALAAEGMEELGRLQRVASEKAGGGPEGFCASGATYVRFAVENPALFRLIFASAPPVSLLDAEPDKVGLAMRGLREDIAALMPPHLPEADRRAAALHAWSLVHGLAMLILDGQVVYEPDDIERVIRASDF
ncbi:TetR/AcrR family transcriptional regulator [Sphingomonas cavernae]|uniref:TetR/AcrR family transcriptional regulator n=1 Tax=Sphingomonas cavernae TaxID=2320861 RepID=A0A418W6H8_9SPHN|nr:TetR/AcrR family transcriptional regulator [Sphingomonas cavernae]RJF85643.1 TetR/AcrR family transcriptional regulator [Sphingomonas cavernae]